MSIYSEALTNKGNGPRGQCPVIVGVYRCMLDRFHTEECESQGGSSGNEPRMLGVRPVGGMTDRRP